MRLHYLISCLFVCGLFLGACSNPPAYESEAEPSSSLARVLGPALADDCPHGGVELEYGIDANTNGELDDDEVNGSYSICHGEPGPAGQACESVEQPDGSFEVQCLGQESVPIPPGPPGEKGEPGVDGANGEPGVDGAPGLTALVTTTAEEAGDACAAGGVRVDSGLDSDNSGTLEASEITQTSAVCHGEKGDSLTFDALTDEQKAALKGEKGDTGDSLTFDALTTDQKAALKGEKGDKGDALLFSDLTTDQIDELKGTPGTDGKDGKEGKDGADGKDGSPGLSMIPYQPFGPGVSLAEHFMSSGRMTLMQFWAPADTTYKNITMQIGHNTSSKAAGALTVAVYKNVPSGGSPGKPATLVAQGKVTAGPGNETLLENNRFLSIPLESGASVAANQLYWVAIGWGGQGAFYLWSHVDHSSLQGGTVSVKTSTAAPDLTNMSVQKESLLPWFRLH